MFLWCKAERPPLFVHELERGLLRFKLNTPALSPLFQLPPRIGHAVNNPFPYENGWL